MKTERFYAVHFDTQYARIYCSWEYITVAANKKEAIEEARNIWNTPTVKHPFLYELVHYGKVPHMFHLDAKRIEDLDGKVAFKFTAIDSRNVTWGRR